MATDAAASSASVAPTGSLAAPRLRLPPAAPLDLLSEEDDASMLYRADGAVGIAAAACSERVRAIALIIAALVAAMVVGTLIGQTAAASFAQFSGVIGWLTAAGPAA